MLRIRRLPYLFDFWLYLSSLAFLEIVNSGYTLMLIISIPRVCVSFLFIVSSSVDELAYWNNFTLMLHVQWNRKAHMVSVLLSYVWRIVPPQWNIPVFPGHQLKNHCKMDAHSIGCILPFFWPNLITFFEPLSERRTHMMCTSDLIFRSYRTNFWYNLL